MLNVLTVSDLHFEFMRDGGRYLIDQLLPKDGVDVLVLAGDICLAEAIPDSMAMFCDRYPHVVAVTGNHEFYGSDRNRVLNRIAAASAKHSNLHYLDKTMVEIGGVRFLGGTLWFANDRNAPKWAMSDFQVIRGNFTQWVYKESDAMVEFLQRELRRGDVVVTHHLPSERSVARQWKGNALNPFFVRAVDPIIEKAKPQLWVHGHTHCSMDYQIGPTRVVCNPFGYLRREENARFDPALIIGVSSPHEGDPQVPDEVG